MLLSFIEISAHRTIHAIWCESGPAHEPANAKKQYLKIKISSVSQAHKIIYQRDNGMPNILNKIKHASDCATRAARVETR